MQWNIYNNNSSVLFKKGDYSVWTVTKNLFKTFFFFREMLAAVKKKRTETNQQIFCEQSSFIKRVTRKFRVVVVQNNGKEMYKKVFCELCFLLIGPFFPFLLPSSLALQDLVFWLNFRYSNESFAFILYSVDKFWLVNHFYSLLKEL